MRERIVQESARMFSKHGIRAVRMDDIAVHLGVSKRTIYEMFGDKDNLIMASLKYYFEEIGRKYEEGFMTAHNMIEKFFIGLNAYDEFILVGHSLMEEVKKFHHSIHERIVKEREECGYPNLKKMIEEGKTEGVLLKNVDPDRFAHILTNALIGIVGKSEIQLGTGTTINDLAKTFVFYFYRGILTMEGLAIFDKEAEKYNNNTKQ